MSQKSKDHYSFEKYIDYKRWMSYFYQLKYCLGDDKDEVLIIGKGDGVLETLIRHYNPHIKVTTFDYAKDLNPDICGDILELSSFIRNRKFGRVACCQVLEHIPFEYLSMALKEIRKVLEDEGQLVLSLPDSGICPDLNIHIPKLGDHRYNIKICKYYKGDFKFNGEHYWEINSARKYDLKKVQKIISDNFDIREEFLVPLNAYHRFFICQIKRNQ